jgi:hypothetical protein
MTPVRKAESQGDRAETLTLEVNDRRLKATAWRRANPTQAFD